jgi:hypothetical protein
MVVYSQVIPLFYFYVAAQLLFLMIDMVRGDMPTEATAQ